jgi:hypothetical protein
VKNAAAPASVCAMCAAAWAKSNASRPKNASGPKSVAIGDEASRADLNARVAQQTFEIFYSSSQAAKSPKALSETMVANNNTIHMV